MAKPTHPPYNVGDLGGDRRRFAPAAGRNVEPIGNTLDEWLPESGTVLEIASGTGEHALAFSRRFTHLEWQPSDPDPLALQSIESWREEGPPNLLPAIRIDAAQSPWPIDHADAILCINMVHISPWASAIGLLDGAARILNPGGRLMLYGPWLEKGVEPAPSNLAFDADLAARDSRWGLRMVEVFAEQAALLGFRLAERRSMPANNLMLRFDRA